MYSLIITVLSPDGNIAIRLEAQWRSKIPDNYWFDYKPTENALKINRERITERSKK